MLPALLRNEVRLVHAFFQMLFIELMYVLVVGSGLLIRRDSLFLEDSVALHCVSLVVNALFQYRKRAPKVRMQACFPFSAREARCRRCPNPPLLPEAAGRSAQSRRPVVFQWQFYRKRTPPINRNSVASAGTE